MAALVAVDACARGAAAPSDPAGLSAYLLDREHDYWQSVCDHDERVVTTPLTMARTVHVATLTRAQPLPRAVAVLGRARVTDGEAAQEILAGHAACYPPRAAGYALEPLYPDRLGEDFIALRTAGHEVPDYLPDEWAAAVPGRLLAAGPVQDADPPWSRTCLTVLVEAAARWPHLAHGQLWPLLRRDPRLALAGGGATLARLAAIDGVTADVLEAVEHLFPEDRDYDLDPGMAVVTEQLTRQRLTATDDPAGRAVLYAALAQRLRNAGRREDATRAYENAVALYRPLACVPPPSPSPSTGSWPRAAAPRPGTAWPLPWTIWA